MKTLDEQLEELDAEIERVRKDVAFKNIDRDKELNNFILESRAHQFALTNLVCSLIAKANNSTLHDEKQRYEVFKKAHFIELLKALSIKYGRTS